MLTPLWLEISDDGPNDKPQNKLILSI